MSPRSPRRRAAAVCLLLLLATLLTTVAGVARAHEFRPALLRVVERVEAEHPGRFDLQLVAPPLAVDGPIAEGELTPIVPAHCALTPRSPIAFRLDCGPQGLVGPLGVAGLERHTVDVVVELRYGDGTRMTAVLGPDAPTLDLGEAAERPGASVFTSYLLLGIEHILLGLDHLLFVLGLLLLVRSRDPRSWKTLLGTVTAFTVAHSLTLAASTLQLFTLPGPPVEAGIALSILLLARELAVAELGGRRDTLSWRFPWLVAFGFGLLHGFGFAGALAEIGLAPEQVPLSLLAFNLGVELGQLIVIAAILVIGAGLRRLLAGRVAEHQPARALIWAMGALAFAWTLERVLDFWPG